MNFFSKSPKKPPTDHDDDSARRSPSPTKRSSFRLHKAKDENLRPGQASSQNNASPTRSQSFSPAFDPNLHPLNLPPDQLRRLSALSNMGGQQQQPLPTEMDVDHEPPNSSPATPAKIANPGLFTMPNTANNMDNVNGTTNGKAPTPPPHRSAPTSPAPPPPPTFEEAEAWKAMGNKYYKNKEYKKATSEYTKGTLLISKHS
jgi:DnaJ homolog subfamily C member 7